GTVAGTGPGGRYGNQIGSQIQQGTVYLGHNNAFGQNVGGNPISIFRSTGGQGSFYAGMLADTLTDFTLGNQQPITNRPLNSTICAFTIGGNQAVNTLYNNAIVVNNPGGGGPADQSAGFALLLAQVASGKTTFAGSMTANGWATAQMKAPVFEKTGAGTVVLQSASSSLKATPVVRAGTLQAEANAPATGDTGVLGDPTITDFGVQNAVQLGGSRPASQVSGGNVRIATVGGIGGTYSATGGANGNGQLTGVSNGGAALDSTPLVVGNRVLLILEGNSQNNSVAPVNGIYKVSAIPSTVTLDREADAVVPGSYVTVDTIATKINSGKRFYLANQNTTFNNGGASGTVQVWLEDEGTSGSLNPTLLAKAGVTIGRDVVVNSSPYINTATLGGTGSGTSTYAGTVCLKRDLALSAVSGNVTVFNGPITGAYAVTVSGAGKVVLNNGGNAFSGAATINGVLGGTGTFANAAFTVVGTLAPGNSVGTLTVSSLTMNDGSSYEWEKDSGIDVADKTVVNGNLDIAGAVTVKVLPLAGATPDGPTVTNTVYQVGGILSGFANLSLDLTQTPAWQGQLVQMADGKSVGVVLAPEPAVLGLALLGLLALRKS
ncbi:MAG: hypothetical protein NTV22_08405, partial [bacterium]|nr:hypothetical protein [bacterium]